MHAKQEVNSKAVELRQLRPIIAEVWAVRVTLPLSLTIVVAGKTARVENAHERGRDLEVVAKEGEHLPVEEKRVRV